MQRPQFTIYHGMILIVVVALLLSMYRILPFLGWLTTSLGLGGVGWLICSRRPKIAARVVAATYLGCGLSATWCDRLGQIEFWSTLLRSIFFVHPFIVSCYLAVAVRPVNDKEAYQANGWNIILAILFVPVLIVTLVFALTLASITVIFLSIAVGAVMKLIIP